MGYCSIDDIRETGVPSTGFGARTDEYLGKVIARVTAMIDRYTGRFFEPRDLTITIDGTGSKTLLLGDPIIAVDSIKVGDDFTTAEEIDLDDVRIYNRHLSENLRNPDDRENPKIEIFEYDAREERIPILGEDSAFSLFAMGRWPEGDQNVQIVGTFGYTDYDESDPEGITPLLIQRAAVLMCLRDLRPAYSEGSMREDDLNRWRVTKLKTRDQSIDYDKPSAFANSSGAGVFTGDPEIDRILLEYVRPAHFGAV